MIFYARTVAPLNCLSRKKRNFAMFASCDFKMMLCFAVVGSIAATAFKFMNNSSYYGRNPTITENA